MRQASPDTYKEVLKEVKANEFYNLVIDTKPENMNFFLKGVRPHQHRKSICNLSKRCRLLYFFLKHIGIEVTIK